MPPRALLALFGGLGIARCPFRGVEPLDLASFKQSGFLYAAPNVFLYAEKTYADSKRLWRLLADHLLPFPSFRGVPEGRGVTTLLLLTP